MGIALPAALPMLSFRRISPRLFDEKDNRHEDPPSALLKDGNRGGCSIGTSGGAGIIVLVLLNGKYTIGPCSSMFKAAIVGELTKLCLRDWLPREFTNLVLKSMEFDLDLPVLGVFGVVPALWGLSCKLV